MPINQYTFFQMLTLALTKNIGSNNLIRIYSHKISKEKHRMHTPYADTDVLQTLRAHKRCMQLKTKICIWFFKPRYLFINKNFKQFLLKNDYLSWLSYLQILIDNILNQTYKVWKFLKWGISHEPLIRKHSYLDHRYPGGSSFIPWLLTPGSMPQVGARGQKLGHY